MLFLGGNLAGNTSRIAFQSESQRNIGAILSFATISLQFLDIRRILETCVIDLPS